MNLGPTTDYSTVAIVIPSFEPTPSLLDFLTELRRLNYGRMILVNDGSAPEYEGIFEAASALGCVVLTHTVNRGKGRALKTAFEYCLSSEQQILDVVTADSDGQHLVDDLVAVTDRMISNRSSGSRAAVLGTRDFNLREIPWRSRAGNKFTSGLVRVLFGRYLADTQTGLRGLPVEQLKDLAGVKGERFEYEMNVLLRLLTTHEQVQEIPISTVYHDMANTQSHFRPIRDSLQVFVQIVYFASSSLLGSLVDIGLYAAIINIFFGGRNDAVGIVVAVIAARIASSVVNFLVNRQLVFRDGSGLRQAILRYYTLAVALLIASAGGSVILARLLDGHVVWAKILVDTLLFAVSYIVQKRWVFVQDNSLRSP